VQEIRQSLRSLIHSPAFALTAILTIALGMGANMAVYAIVRAVLLEPLPFRAPQQLVQVWESHPELHNLQVAVPDYWDWKKSIKTLDLGAYTFQAMNKGSLTGYGDPIAIQATNASSDLFSLLGVEPLAGHFYNSQEEARKQHLAVIGEHLWRTKFGSSYSVIGRQIGLDGTGFTISGVVPDRKAFPAWADVWLPLSLIDPATSDTRKYHPLEVIGRLHPGVNIRQAEIETEQVARQLSVTYPATNGKIGAFMVPLMDSAVGDVRPALIATWIAVALVLFIACANLAHLMMARALTRRRELAVRLAVGASKWAAFRTFLFETLLLSSAGAALGVLIAQMCIPLIRHLAQGDIPRLNGVELNSAVLAFGVAATLVVAGLFALPCLWRVMRTDLNETISAQTPRVSGRETWLSAGLMSSEIALSLAVLLGAVVLVRSFALALATNPGFRPDHTVAVDTPLVQGDGDKSYTLLTNRIFPDLSKIPEVEEVAAVNSVPMSLGPTEHSRFATRFGIVGRQFEPGRFPTTQLRWSTANYFTALGIPLERGRVLKETDYNQPRYLVNEAFALRFFPDANPVGQKLLMGVLSPHPQQVEVVGVVGDVREFGLTAGAEPAIYTVGASPEMQVVVKTAREDAATLRAIGQALRRINSQQAIGPVKLLSNYVSASLARQRFILAMIGTFAALAMCLCVLGIYGVFNYSVNRRMREFGIRSAIGARKSHLIGQVTRECLRVVVPGLVGGLCVSLACARLLRTMLYRVSPFDPPSVLLVSALIVVLCLASVTMPARRAARVEPAEILREQ
jgi:predicted permease